MNLIEFIEEVSTINVPDILMNDFTLLVKLSKGGKLPSRGSSEAAGLDLCAAEEIIIPSKNRRAVDTAVHI